MTNRSQTLKTRNREWGFYGTITSNGGTDPDEAWDVMMATLTDPDGPFALSQERARDLLDARFGRHLADEFHEIPTAEYARVMAEHAASRRWMKHYRQTHQALFQETVRQDPKGETKMTVNEMIERLQEAAEDGYGDCEVLLAHQPNYPLQFTVAGVATPDDADRYQGPPDEEHEDEDDEPGYVYIVEGPHPEGISPYGPAWPFAIAQ